MIREAFATDLLGAAAFARRVDQLDTVGVDNCSELITSGVLLDYIAISS